MYQQSIITQVCWSRHCVISKLPLSKTPWSWVWPSVKSVQINTHGMRCRCRESLCGVQIIFLIASTWWMWSMDVGADRLRMFSTWMTCSYFWTALFNSSSFWAMAFCSWMVSSRWLLRSSASTIWALPAMSNNQIQTLTNPIVKHYLTLEGKLTSTAAC